MKNIITKNVDSMITIFIANGNPIANTLIPIKINNNAATAKANPACVALLRMCKKIFIQQRYEMFLI